MKIKKGWCETEDNFRVIIFILGILKRERILRFSVELWYGGDKLVPDNSTFQSLERVFIKFLQFLRNEIAHLSQ